MMASRVRNLVKQARVGGETAVIEVGDRADRRVVDLADVVAGAHLHPVDPDTHASAPLAPDSCDAVVVGPGVSGLDDSTRLAVLDDALRAIRPGGQLMLIAPADRQGGPLPFAEASWQPGAPQGWWTDPLSDRFEDIRYARAGREIDVIIARRTSA